MKPKLFSLHLIGWLLVLACITGQPAAATTPRAEGLRLAVFDVDATPPIGSMMAYNPVKAQGDLGLRGRGVVLLGAGEPIVLCAMDWIGLANECYDAFRRGLAEAAGTTPQRVAVHAVHQHDAPECDFGTERLLRERGLPLGRYEGSFAREVLERLAAAVRTSLSESKPITHIGLGKAKVHKVASNRRILGPDGKVRAMRYTATKDAALRAEPEGTIDPIISLVSFWNNDQPLAVLSYYACHPQSYYRTGIANPDFPGIARFLRQQQVPDALHVHFNGAGGNVGAGKYNDGSHSTRWVLAQRLADGMKRAWEATQKLPLTQEDVGWQVVSVALPPVAHLKESELETTLSGSDKDLQSGAAARLVWLRRCQAGHQTELSCLRLGRARVLHLPGELFVEYQLAAKQMRQDLFVAMAAYGDYGTGYIGTTQAYEQGGYETSPSASNVAPEVETVLLDGMRKLLHVNSRSDTSVAESRENMVATVHPLATEAGIGVLRRGGNAVDAAVGAALTLGVVDGFNSGIGGGCFILIRTADGRVVAIDGREMAPAAARRDMYLVDSRPDTTLSQIGPLAIGVPGALKAYEQVVREYGRTEFSELINDAARIAEYGFEVTEAYSRNLESVKVHLKKYPGSRATLLKDDGSVYQPGDVLRQPDLANTYQQIAEHGVDWFYRGRFARRCAEWLQANGGIITAQDFQDYATVRREPIKSTYRGYTVYGFPPPSSGGVHVAQILNILERFDLASLYKRDRAKFVHIVAQAMKLAFADR
ncbi:MAG TPA: gamma-glutamyltransferase, partial [Hyphomicrobiaceae bacterium]|nr:gamma-glutamyltransferase [Hyphomicrobiaceae bacterium]